MSIILTQTDTTVGFLSQNDKSLIRLKNRDSSKPFLKVYSSLARLNNSIRVPLKYRSLVRHAKKTTFVINNQAVRYVQDEHHARLIERYGWLYSTSANESGKEYDELFCRSHSDLIVEDARGLKPTPASKIFRLTSTQSKKLR